MSAKRESVEKRLIRSMQQAVEISRSRRAEPCDCESCRAARTHRLGGLHCCPRNLSHGLNCICGATFYTDVARGT